MGMNIKLKPINSRFKRLIKDFGADWVTICDPVPFPCFNGVSGVTARPANMANDGNCKWSNFKIEDVE